MKEVIMDSEMLFEFRKWVAENESDGLIRGLWYDEEENKFFRTCETVNTNYVFDNPNKIYNLILIRGDNNSKGLKEVCNDCMGCTDEFMIEHNIKLSYADFSELMEQLYQSNDKTNKYNITEEEIEKYEEDSSCSWFTNYLTNICTDVLDDWYEIDVVNWGDSDLNDNIEFIEE